MFFDLYSDLDNWNTVDEGSDNSHISDNIIQALHVSRYLGLEVGQNVDNILGGAYVCKYLVSHKYITESGDVMHTSDSGSIYDALSEGGVIDGLGVSEECESEGKEEERDDSSGEHDGKLVG